MNKPQIGIVPIWWEGNPCNSHLLDLAREVKEGCKSEGLVGLTFNTIGSNIPLCYITNFKHKSRCQVLYFCVRNVLLAELLGK